MNDQLLASRAVEPTPLPIKRQLPARAARAHALKNCLAIVCAVNELVEPDLGAAAQRRLARSTRALRRMAELIEEDLKQSGVSCQNGGVEFVSAEQVFEAVRLRVEDFAESRRVRLEFLVGPGGLWGDRKALTEALGNIVKNAIESSGAGDTVVAAASTDGLEGQLWTVRDQGPGIPGDVLPHLGTPFVSRKDGGTGLGIAVARDVFENHGGLLHIESAPGGGTMVSIWFRSCSPPTERVASG
jgi:signal transduction histidine kinase